MNGRQQLALAACLFLIGSAEVVAGPMMRLMGPHFGVTPSAIAYLPAAYGLTYGTTALIAGPISDRFGRKRPLRAGLFGFAILSLLLPSAPNLTTAVVLSAMSGLCAAIIQPNAMALTADEATPADVGRMIGRVFIGLMLAFVVTPALAGRVADTAGWWTAYYALAALALATCVAVTLLFEGRPIRSATVAGFVSIHRGALRTKGVRRRLAASYLWLGWMAGFGAVVAEVAAKTLPLSPTRIGLLAGFWGLAVIAGNLAGGRLYAMVGATALPVMAIVGALGIFGFMLPVGGFAAFAVVGLPWAFGYGCAGPLHHATLSGLSTTYRGTINSYHASLINLGIFSASLLLGALGPSASPFLFCGSVGLVALAGASLLLVGLPPIVRRPSRAL